MEDSEIHEPLTVLDRNIDNGASIFQTTVPDKEQKEESKIYRALPNRKLHVDKEKCALSYNVPQKESKLTRSEPDNELREDSENPPAVLDKIQTEASEFRTAVSDKEQKKDLKEQPTVLHIRQGKEALGFQTTVSYDEHKEDSEILPIFPHRKLDKEKLTAQITVRDKNQKEVLETPQTVLNTNLDKEPCTFQSTVPYKEPEEILKAALTARDGRLDTEDRAFQSPVPDKEQKEESTIQRTVPGRKQRVDKEEWSFKTVIACNKPETDSEIQPTVPDRKTYKAALTRQSTVPYKDQEGSAIPPTVPDRKPYIDASNFIPMDVYKEQEKRLSSLEGRQLIAQHDDECVVMYQTFSPGIADYAVRNGKLGGPEFDTNRTTWLKLSFLWTMKTSKWATLPGRERVLAIKINKDAFLEILNIAASTGTVYQTPPGKDSVTLYWKVDYDIDGEPLDRLTLLIGLRSYMLKNLNSKYIDTIHDVTDYVRKQCTLVRNKDHAVVMVPFEKQFVPGREELCWAIMLHDFYITPSPLALLMIFEKESLRKRKPNQNVVLYLQGAFNPVHTKHVQIMLQCRDWMERNAKCTVVAAFMGVRSNATVTDKIRKNENSEGLVLKHCHRLAMCEIAVLPHNWIHVYGIDTDMSIRKHSSEILKQNDLKGGEYFCIFGADRGIGMCYGGISHALFVGREGTTDELKQVYSKTLMEGMKGGLSITDTYIIPVEMENVNSTEIRQCLKRMSRMDSIKEKREEISQLTEKGWLDNYVADYLVEYENDLYENIRTK